MSEGSIEDVLAGRATHAVVCGDAVEVMAPLPSGCVHVCYCDPSYGLASITTADTIACLTAWLAGKPYAHRSPGFMGHEWDSWVPGPEAWREVHRALKPGGYCVAFSSTRTVDLLGIAVRLAGFDVREGWAWVTGSAFPKSLDVSKALDAAAGADREVVGTKAGLPGYSLAADRGRHTLNAADDGSLSAPDRECAITAPATDAARAWDGYGTTTKPSFEPVVVARKALDGTVAANVQRHGCGALNIDAARIAAGGASPSIARRESALRSGNTPTSRGASPSGWDDRTTPELHTAPRASEQLGRFPSALALVHDEGCERVGTRKVRGFKTPIGHATPTTTDATHGFARRSTVDHTDADGFEEVEDWRCTPTCAVHVLGEQSGETRTGGNVNPTRQPVGYNGSAERVAVPINHGDTGTAARFFYCAKASSADRLAFVSCTPGCAHHETVIGARDARRSAKCPACGAERAKHEHSTVKPLDLARYHARLLSLPAHVAPVALVPFCGTGVEARALMEMGFRVIAVDLDPRHCAMTRHRLAQPLDAPKAKPARKAAQRPAEAPAAPVVAAVAPTPAAATTKPARRPAASSAQLPLGGIL